jgi:hypothetical protein
MSEGRRERLGLALQVLEVGLSRALAACAAGAHVSTLARWRRRFGLGQDLVSKRGPQQADVNDASSSQASALVRDLRGLLGADSLRRSVPGITRRAAAAIKATTCTAMERERRGAAERVHVTIPGVVRAFDSMHMRGAGHLLVAADGSVPFRTSWALVPRYDGGAVASLFARDFERHGAPLVLRMDRARQHSVSNVQAVLDRYRVLTLHGPAYRAQYYGQLERQNREHRAWLRRVFVHGREGLEAEVETMMAALTGSWRRRTLDWRTAAEAWSARPQERLDREDFRREVTDRACRIATSGGASNDLAWRLAIEQVLLKWGLLTITKEGWS